MWYGVVWRLAWDGMAVGMGWHGGWHGLAWWLAYGGCRFFHIVEGVAWQTAWYSRLVVYGMGFAADKVVWQWQWQWRRYGILGGLR